MRVKILQKVFSSIREPGIFSGDDLEVFEVKRFHIVRPRGMTAAEALETAGIDYVTIISSDDQ